MKITKSELRQRCIDNETAIATLETLLKEHGIARKQEPKLKQLDQSVFDGADPKYITAATNEDGRTFLFPVPKSELEHALGCWLSDYRGDSPRVDGLFDTTNWQNSLIERDIAKELLEVDLSSELKGSDLCRAMLKRGDRIVLCAVSDTSDTDALESNIYDAITLYKDGRMNPFESSGDIYMYAVPINNKGEPLTAADVGL